jgi:MFS family permease
VPFTLITRYAQTEPVAGYGFGLNDFEAGLVVVPFSVLGFFGGRVAARLQGRVGPFALLAANGILACLACCLFATVRDSLVWPVISMVILGAAVGGFWAAMPGAILTATPIAETAEAMSLNQLLRSAGFSIGSAMTGMILAAHTSAADRFPTESGYSTAAWAGAAVTGASIVLALLTGAAARRFARPVAPLQQSSAAVRSGA